MSTRCAASKADLEEQAVRPRPLGRPGTRPGGHLPAVLRQRRDQPAGAACARRHRRRRACCSSWPRPRRDAGSVAEVRRRARRAAQGRRRDGGPHPALRRVRLPRGAGGHPRRRRWRGRRRLRRDADADVPALGRAARLPDRGLRDLVRRGGGPQVGHLRGQGAVRLRHAVASSRAPTGWCGSARSTTRAGGRPASPASRSCRWSSRPTTSTSRRTRSGSTSTARPARVDRASTPPTRRCGSRTSRPASW